MIIKERMRLAAKDQVFTVVTPWARMTGTKTFFLSCFEDIFLKLEIKSEIQTDDGRSIITTEGNYEN